MNNRKQKVITRKFTRVRTEGLRTTTGLSREMVDRFRDALEGNPPWIDAEKHMVQTIAKDEAQIDGSQ